MFGILVVVLAIVIGIGIVMVVVLAIIGIVMMVVVLASQTRRLLGPSVSVCEMMPSCAVPIALVFRTTQLFQRRLPLDHCIHVAIFRFR